LGVTRVTTIVMRQVCAKFRSIIRYSMPFYFLVCCFRALSNLIFLASSSFASTTTAKGKVVAVVFVGVGSEDDVVATVEAEVAVTVAVAVAVVAVVAVVVTGSTFTTLKNMDCFDKITTI
jgi:hypothetical protein